MPLTRSPGPRKLTSKAANRGAFSASRHFVITHLNKSSNRCSLSLPRAVSLSPGLCISQPADSNVSFLTNFLLSSEESSTALAAERSKFDLNVRLKPTI